MAEPLKPSFRLEGGIPNVPKGEIVVEPINAWGRPMPKYEAPRRPPRYQVHVKDSHFGRTMPVGPQRGREYAELFRLSIANQIASGAEQRWSEPHLVLMM